ncbi:hypothetical protein O5O45_14135 [Hahella aquimaris]|uniref:hypothetical protein n=1 Tax=Hahella sp. HNIBRBA332 TaxID=3015983 RepID=UPI00273B00CE|nr:hypothetical protein [Hahella sp. HNIBRBA332]WLQ17055.1 hypothetical protein O5O45_14135 [Hahella sp. HNIBRBA332]
MKTVVIQSFRTHDVPPWVEKCRRSVVQWAQVQGYEYLFYDDRFFDCLPDWYRVRTGGQIHLMADLARLERAAELLAAGYERVIWVDIDVYIGSPERLKVADSESFAFCREVWISESEGALHRYHRVNNAIAVFCRNNPFLDFYRYSCKQMVRHDEALRHVTIGTSWLTHLHERVRFPLLNHVALLSPWVLQDLSRGEGKFLEMYRQEFAAPVYAVNLCLTFRNKNLTGRTVTDGDFERAILHFARLGSE